MIQLYQKFNWLSLDVVLGALVCYRMAALLPDGYGVMNWPTAIVLGLLVFAIYSIDRIIDNEHEVKNTNRHQFQFLHKNLIIKAILVCIGVALVLLFWVPKNVILVGAALMGVMIIYLLLVKKTKSKGWFEAAKDLLVPLIYSLGVWGVAIASHPDTNQESLILFFPFWLITQQNLLISAYYESFDADGGGSLPILWGEHATRIVLTVIFVLIVLFCLWVIIISPFHYAVRVSIFMIAMGGIQHFIWQDPTKYISNDIYRVLLEGVYLIPLLA